MLVLSRRLTDKGFIHALLPVAEGQPLAGALKGWTCRPISSEQQPRAARRPLDRLP
jgi:hypothetical protein